MKYLLDTNVFREIGKSQLDQRVKSWLASVDDSDLAISALTVREVAKGVARLRSRKPQVAAAIGARIRLVFADFAERTLPVDRVVADLWDTMLAESEKHIDDVGLAATARVHDLILVTRNLAHVVGRGAAVLDPSKASPSIMRP